MEGGGHISMVPEVVNPFVFAYAKSRFSHDAAQILYDIKLTSKHESTAVSGVGSSPALATCETSQVLLADVSGGFPGVLPFRPTYTDWPVSMSEIILKGTLNLIQKNNKKKHES